MLVIVVVLVAKSSDSFVTHQAPLSMEFSRQEYENGLPFPSPGDLPDAGIELMSPALAGGFFTTEPPGKHIYMCVYVCIHITQSLCSIPETSN